MHLEAQAFKDKLVEIVSVEDDYVWIHDYHLMVLPSLLRKRFLKIRCGFFLHSPFPSSEIFRTFPKREEVLRSLLNADVVGEDPSISNPSTAMLFMCCQIGDFNLQVNTTWLAFDRESGCRYCTARR